MCGKNDTYNIVMLITRGKSIGRKKYRNRRRTRRSRVMKGGSEDKPLAIIVEPRQHKALTFVLRNFAENLPPEWNILVLHVKDNEAWLKEKLAEGGELADVASKIKLTSISEKTISRSDYNKMLQSIDFYEHHIPAETETFIFFQLDSMICKPHKDLLNNFLKYDYVGAPWPTPFHYSASVPWTLIGTSNVGNGGLSLRKKSKMLEMLRKCPPAEPSDSLGEDSYFSAICNNVQINRPTADQAREFSIEMIYHPKSWGVHKPWAYLHWNNGDTLEAQCPGIKQLKELYEGN